MAVTAAESGSSANKGVYLEVRVLTGATEAGGASTSGVSLTGAAPQGTITPNFTNSLPVWAISADNISATPSFTIAANNTAYQNLGNTTDTWAYGSGYYSGTVTASTPITCGASANIGSPDQSSWAVYEVPPSGASTPVVDASSPALASNGSSVSITTATFLPPAGSVIVAMVVVGGSGGGSGITTTVSGGGLTWTQRAVAPSTAVDQAASVWTATVPAASTGITVANLPVNVHATSGSVTGSWAGHTTTAGNLLVAAVTVAAATSCTATATSSSWSQAAGHGIEEPNSTTAHARAAIWTLTALGNDAAPTFTSTLSGTGAMDCMLLELTAANTTTPIDTSGVFASGSSTATLAAATFTATTTGNVAAAGEFAIAVFCQERAAGIWGWTDSGTGGYFGALLSGNNVSSVCQTYIGVAASPPSGATLNDKGQFSTDTTAYGAALVAVFSTTAAPAASVTTMTRGISMWR